MQLDSNGDALLPTHESRIVELLEEPGNAGEPAGLDMKAQDKLNALLAEGYQIASILLDGAAVLLTRPTGLKGVPVDIPEEMRVALRAAAAGIVGGAGLPGAGPRRV